MAEERIYFVTINYGPILNTKYAAAATTVYQAGNKAEKQFKADYAAEKNYHITSIQELGDETILFGGTYVFIK